ncbi:MAG: thioredoxin family protein [Hyphomicrobiales bacterium]
MRHFFKPAIVAAVMLISSASYFITAQAAELLMFEHVGCVQCKLFKKETLADYQASKFAKDMPIRSIVANDPDPFKGLTDIKGAPFYYSPTFILVQDGKELVRIRGYAGKKAFMEQISNIHANHHHKLSS